MDDASAEAFGELRSLVHQAPSWMAWQKLRRVLDRYADDDQVLGQLLPYCQRVIARWDDDLVRAAPSWWVERAFRGQGNLLSLANRIEWRHNHLGDRDACTFSPGTLWACPHLGALRELDLSFNALSDDDIVELAAHLDAMPNLRRLDVRQNLFSFVGKRALGQACGDRVPELVVIGI